MPIGAFKLTTISAAAAVAAESYFILYSTSIGFNNVEDINIDAEGRFLIKFSNSNLAKITNTGTITWQKQPSSSFTTAALKNNGEAVVFGQGDNGVKFLLYELSNASGAENYKTQRNHSTFNGFSPASNYTAAVDSSHSAFFGGLQRDGSANYMNFIFKVDDSGNFSFTRWGITSGSYNNNSAGPNAFAKDSSNNIYVRIVDQTNYYLVKYNNSLTHQWTKELTWSAAPTKNRFGRVAVGSDGSVYGGGTGAQAKIWKMDSSQARAWEYQLSVAINLQPDCVEIDSSNNVYYYGTLSNTGYIFKVNSSGTLQWTRTVYINNFMDGFKVRIINDIMYVFGLGYVTGDVGGYIMKLPTDGTKTGTYGNFVYSSVSATLTSINEMTITAITPTIDGGTIGNYNGSTTASLTYGSPGFSTLTKTTL
jgi:hypothetical protein